MIFEIESLKLAYQIYRINSFINTAFQNLTVTCFYNIYSKLFMHISDIYMFSVVNFILKLVNGYLKYFSFSENALILLGWDSVKVIFQTLRILLVLKNKL